MNRPEAPDAAVELSADEADDIRHRIAEAVLAGPAGLAAALQDQPEAYLKLVAASQVAAEHSNHLLRDAVAGARRAGHSWEVLGRLLGVSRQAAHQRFGGTEDPAADHDGTALRRQLSPLTAFDEMDVLNTEGRYGWHSVSFGMLYHVVEASPWQWEHSRVPFTTPRRRMEADGWTPIGRMWFPWAYYKRRLDQPAEVPPAAAGPGTM
jgi:hypothetical protein